LAANCRTSHKLIRLENRTIASFAVSDIDHFLRFRTREDMQRLLAVWQLPDEVLIDKRWVTGEELLLFGIRRVSCMHTLHALAVDEFGRDWSFGARLLTGFSVGLRRSSPTSWITGVCASLSDGSHIMQPQSPL
jgi:hypothetical protein